MNILLTNDDGIHAIGLHELANALRKAGHRLFIAAPSVNRSCVSHGLTIGKPLYADKVVLEGLEDVPSYAISGTPADCVRLAAGNLFSDIDLVISGINQASNLGSDSIYSGTVAAAIEGYMIDYPSVAVSKDVFSTDFMTDAAEYTATLIPSIMKFFKDGAGVLNINFPCMKRSEYRGVRVGDIALQKYTLRYDEETEEDGRIAYRIRLGKITEVAEDEGSDERFIRDGFVTVTPLTYSFADKSRMSRARMIFERDE